VTRREFLDGCAGLVGPYVAQPFRAATRHVAQPFRAASLPFRFTDVTAAAGLSFRHNSGAYGGKLLPETLGAGCAFIDYDADGWPDILLINSADWAAHKRRRTTLALYRNNRNGTFTDVTKAAGLDVEMYGMGVAVADFNNDGFQDFLVTCVGQNRLFRNTGKGTFVDVTKQAGLAGRSAFSTSAMWVDIDRDGHLDLFVCNYVKWSAERDVFCSVDGKTKSYCTPEAYRGDTCWLFRNRGNGTFEDVTATCGIFDTSSKSLGVAAIDYDGDGWPDLFVANDTQPNKLYRNLRNGTFKDVAIEAGVAFSADGRARAGMGADAAFLDRSGRPSLAVTNFDNEMIGLYRSGARLQPDHYEDVAMRAGIGAPSRSTLGFGCAFGDVDLDGAMDLIVANGHIDETVRNIRGNVGYAQPPHLFLNDGSANFRDVASAAGAGFADPKVGRGLALADFDRDGDVDVLMTTNNGPARLYRNDHLAGHRSIRFRLVGTKSNRDAIGALVTVHYDGTSQSQMVKSGSSYLSQSELPLTFGVGRRDRVDRVVVAWPSGRAEEFRNVASAKSYACVEGAGMK
jgi:enediyne biosynthesis protein E4